MAYVEARPLPYSSQYDHGSYRKGTSGRWNPKQQEVIVIDDSASPERIIHHEPPSNNTRGAANKRRRLPQSQAHANHARDIADYGAMQMSPLVPQPLPYGTYTQPLYGVPVGVSVPYVDPFSQTSSSSQLQYGYAPAESDMRSSFGSPYVQQQLPQIPVTGKRKRAVYDGLGYERMPMIRHSTRHSTLTAQSSTSSRHGRAYMKNREVVLRQELDVLPNFSGKPFDDAEGHYVIVPNTELTSRYQIDRLLGQGTFGKVVRAYDKQKRIWVAIKIIRAIQKYRDASMIELRVLRTLHENDARNLIACIHLQDCFDYRNHVCIVTELLNQSIFDFLKSNNFAPFPDTHIQSFAKQLFTSVAFLHDLDLIHTDLKPENILLVDNDAWLQSWHGRSNVRTRKVLKNTELRLIDFGSATFQDEYHSNVVSTRHYRAPEIILGMGWSFPCDIWSIGCILIEFFTGDALFQTHDNVEHLAMMEVVCGRIDGRIIRSCSKVAQKMFRPSGRLDYPSQAPTKDSRKFVRQMKSLGEMFPPSSAFNNSFCDLLSRIFVYEPRQRITAREALKHSFFRQQFED